MLRTMPERDPAINPAADEAAPGPADRLRERLTHGHGRYSVIAGTLTIWIMDTLLSRRLEMSGAVTGSTADIVRTFETASTILFVITSIALIVTLLSHIRGHCSRWPQSI